MTKTSLVLTGLLLFFVQTVSEENCTDILDTCKTHLGSILNSITTDKSSFYTRGCQSRRHRDNECNILYHNFWACMGSKLSKCGDTKFFRELQLFETDYMNRCAQGMCEIKIDKCFCLIDPFDKRNESNAMLAVSRRCKEQKVVKDCLNKIEDCDHSTTKLRPITHYKLLKQLCTTECHASFLCVSDLLNAVMSSVNASGDTENVCRHFRTLFQCFSANTKACSTNHSENWLRIERNFEAVCSAFTLWPKSSNCSSLKTCVGKKDFAARILFLDEVTSRETIDMNIEYIIAYVNNPGWWCSLLIHAQTCLKTDDCHLNASEGQQASAFNDTLELCEGTDDRHSCPAYRYLCNPSLKSDAQFAAKTRQSIQFVQCHVIQSVETTCISFEEIKTCANDILLRNVCENSSELSSELRNLQESYTDPCSKDNLCAVELVKCACTADLLDTDNMCKTMDTYKNCAGKIKGCDKATTVWQPLSVTFKTAEGACTTECPSSFTCWMDAQDQVDYLFPRLYSAVETMKSHTCRSLVERFQCLSRNTSSCSDSLSHKWQQVVKSYETVCTVFEQTPTKTWSCPSVRTCVDETKLVPGVSLGDLKTLVSVSLSAADIGVAILTPSTWCRILINATECMVQEAEACLLTTIKENLAAANATVRNLCKEKFADKVSLSPLT
ncbi:uncharacterized protein LOC112559727 [Pomacea canaliculata]|uniref:uncharacterized protein LOC112559727 n=1 Tax=Pomacea canaliculata TaxID=400727 RepID=UPI000D73CD9F|nr:uncharacterized protein LOC112559727 [Pomacea canaliculata]